jgi:acyl transferase domain-containing protein/3-hydroxymyristoyl/3-hydroxydecanoyl-(acyl carrier protein) dehydratase/1-acyl-sn-glycerol-3-phosphate acyltransferase
MSVAPEPIAIVGRGCVLPGHTFDPAAMWAIARAGRVVIDDATDADWGMRIAPHLAPAGRHHIADTVWDARGGYVRGFEAVFRAEGLELPGEKVAALDRVFRWPLYAARAALQEAGGAAPDERPRSAVIFGNIGQPTGGLIDWTAEVAGLRPSGAAGLPWENRFCGGLPAALTAQALSLGCELSFGLDAACASGLVALKHACDLLRAGTVDLALAGGINAAEPLQQRIVFCAFQAASRSGQCRPFAREADGLVPGEGCAVLALRRLDDALRRGDRILGLIRGIGTSNDGRGPGLLAPAEDGQVRAIAQAWSEAGLDPALLSYAECHATGTALGDAQELRSCARGWGSARDVTLASHKASFGHLITAAGAVGVLQVLGCFEHETLVPTPGPRPLIAEVEATRCRVLDQAAPWAPRDGRRIATVSAFGMGGNNAHLVLEGWSGAPEQRVGTGRARPRVAASQPELAVVALALRTDRAANADAFLQTLVAPTAVAAPLDEVELTPAQCAFPPKDLRCATGAQLLALATAQAALAQIPDLPRAETAVFLGQSPDTRLARACLRLRWNQLAGAGDAAARDAMHPPIDFAVSMGGLPNFPANRINSACDLRGASEMVWGEELSGDIGLRLAQLALARGECRAALVGAVELAREPANAAAQPGAVPADVAVMLVVTTAEHARDAGWPVHAFIRPASAAEGAPAARLPNTPEQRWLAAACGHAHAASGLWHVAAAALLASRRVLLTAPGAAPLPLLPGGGQTDYQVETLARHGAHAAWSVRAGPGLGLLARGLRPRPRVRLFAGGDTAELAAAIRAGREAVSDAAGPCRLGWVETSTRTAAAQRADALALLEREASEGRTPGGVAWRREPLAGEVAQVFTGAAAAYPRNGDTLLLAFPGLIARAAEIVPDQRTPFGDVFSTDPAVHRLPLTQSAASGFLIHLHGLLTHEILRLPRQRVFGLSSGETNAMSVIGVWAPDPPFISAPGIRTLYEREMGGEFAAVRRHWQLAPEAPVAWENWIVRAPPAAVRAALEGETRCFLTLVTAPSECAIGGQADACARVIGRLGASGRAVPMGHDLVVHCEVTRAWEDGWRTLHTRPCAALPAGVTLYSNFLDAAYVPTPERVAEALTGQALVTVDFPRLVRRVHADGARIFVEHGPRGGCTAAIRETLGAQPHVAVALDQPGRDGAEQVALAAVELWCAGVPVTLAAFQDDARAAVTREATLSFPLHLPPMPKPCPPAVPVRILARAPQLAAVRTRRAPRSGTSNRAAALLDWHHRLTIAHADQVAHQEAALREFIAFSTRLQSAALLAGPSTPVPSAPRTEATEPASAPTPAPLELDRAQCEVLAQGRQADVLGAEFAFLDDFAVQVRLPQAPYLFCDRLGGLTQPLVFGQQSLWTEYRVPPASWLLHDGRMLMGPFWETLQADLTLVAWMGIDRHNAGRRRYRLLGGEFTMHGPLPEAGDLIRCDIWSDGIKRQGEMHLFYFRDRMTVNGAVRLTVERGVAGFFTDAELEHSEGVVWNPAKARYTAGATIAPPMAHATDRTAFTREQLRAWTRGDAPTCFGPKQASFAAHTRTPRPPGGRTGMIHSVDALDFAGGPAGRGYLRAQLELNPSWWFFACHFKDDPCMPGTMMLEGAVQVLSFYLAALGHAAGRDGWRFEPVWPRSYNFLCRAQVQPAHRRLTYEVFVDEITAGREPAISAHLLFHVDGKPAMLMEGFAVRLVPAWPADDAAALLEPTHADARPVAQVGGIPCDRASLVQFALGRPSRMFGTHLAACDALFRGPARLPAPPYLFCTRALWVDGEPGVARAGMGCEFAYDLAPDAWFFGDHGQGMMPLAIQMEAMLQASGWLTGFNCNPRDNLELKVRNLDGVLRMKRPVRPTDRCLRTTVRLVSFSKFGDVNLQKYALELRLDDEQEPVATCETVFGFFPEEALATQVGLPVEPAELAQRHAAGGETCELTAEPPRYYEGALRLGRGRLKLLDAIEGFWPEGGKRGRGYVRARRRVSPDDWFFKAHFFRDPVQPGSLGLEAMQQLFAWYLLRQGRGADFVSPVFEPLVCGEDFEWHYRGQITQDISEMILDAEIHEETRDERGWVVRGEARLWVGDKKIYHVTRGGLRIVEGAPVVRRLPAYEVDAHLPLTRADGRLDVPAILGAWERTLGGRGGLLRELAGALLDRCVRRVLVEDPHDVAAWRGRPVLFLANHQVGVETLLLSLLGAALGEAPVASIAKRELAGGWPDLVTGLFREAFQGPPPVQVLYFDREDRESLPKLLAEFVASLASRPRSLLLHVEGTRAQHANQPVARMSTVFTDLAVRAGLPIVPVRLTGGLPFAADGRKHEYPVGGGRQDYWFGRAIQPEELAALPFAERPRRVLAAINALGPVAGAEAPFSSDEELDTRIRRRVTECGWREFPALLHAVLEDWVATEGVEAAQAAAWLQRLEKVATAPAPQPPAPAAV